MFMLTEKQMVDVVEAVNAAYDFLDGYVDVVDGSYGEPAPNKAMSLQQCLGEVQNTLDKAMNALSEIKRLRAALVEIAESKGRFSADQFQHAKNTIEDMKALAVALDVIPAQGQPDRLQQALTVEEEYLLAHFDADCGIMPGDVQGSFHRIREALSPQDSAPVCRNCGDENKDFPASEFCGMCREMGCEDRPTPEASDAREAVARMLVPYWLGGFERQERNERGHWEYPPYTPNARAYEIADKALAIIAARHSQEATAYRSCPFCDGSTDHPGGPPGNGQCPVCGGTGEAKR